MHRSTQMFTSNIE